MYISTVTQIYDVCSTIIVQGRFKMVVVLAVLMWLYRIPVRHSSGGPTVILTVIPPCVQSVSPAAYYEVLHGRNPNCNAEHLHSRTVSVGMHCTCISMCTGH